MFVAARVKKSLLIVLHSMLFADWVEFYADWVKFKNKQTNKPTPKQRLLFLIISYLARIARVVPHLGSSSIWKESFSLFQYRIHIYFKNSIFLETFFVFNNKFQNLLSLISKMFATKISELWIGIKNYLKETHLKWHQQLWKVPGRNSGYKDI